jgi:hypothetical protein
MVVCGCQIILGKHLITRSFAAKKYVSVVGMTSGRTVQLQQGMMMIQQQQLQQQQQCCFIGSSSSAAPPPSKSPNGYDPSLYHRSPEEYQRMNRTS